MVQVKRFKKATLKVEGTDDSRLDGSNSKRGSDDEDHNESGSESDVTNATGNASDGEEEDSMTNEELEKKLEKLQKVS